MDIVIDTSVIIAVIAGESERERLIEMTEGMDLLAPRSVHWEIGNAFSAMLRRGRVTLEQVLRAIEAYGQIPIRYVEVGLKEALKVAAEEGMYAYDAYLIQCAERYRAPLLTLDRGLMEVARRRGLEVMEV
jgi:predicted nucleic acid-binding protein